MFIQIRDLQFQYKNTKKNTLDHIQVDIERGEIVSILGKSGSERVRCYESLQDSKTLRLEV